MQHLKNSYTLVYAASCKPTSYNDFLTIWVVVIAFTLLAIYLFYKKYKILSGIIGIGVYLLMPTTAIWNYESYNRCSKMIKNKTYTMVEGEISNYKPHSAYNKESASFYVNGIKFFSDYHGFNSDLNNNLNNHVQWRDGLKVKIYYRNDNKIVRDILFLAVFIIDKNASGIKLDRENFSDDISFLLKI